MSEKNFHGLFGSAFECELLPPDDRPNPDTMTCLGRWNLRLPGQHALWNRYSLCLCHLRDCAGIAPAVKKSPEMTHEITVFAIDPNYDEELFQKGGIAILEPVNHVVQFKSPSDARSIEVAKTMVQRLVDGKEFAEPSGIQGARDRFEMSLLLSVGKA